MFRQRAVPRAQSVHMQYAPPRRTRPGGGTQSATMRPDPNSYDQWRRAWHEGSRIEDRLLDDDFAEWYLSKRSEEGFHDIWPELTRENLVAWGLRNQEGRFIERNTPAAFATKSPSPTNTRRSVEPKRESRTPGPISPTIPDEGPAPDNAKTKSTTPGPTKSKGTKEKGKGNGKKPTGGRKKAPAKGETKVTKTKTSTKPKTPTLKAPATRTTGKRTRQTPATAPPDWDANNRAGEAINLRSRRHLPEPTGEDWDDLYAQLEAAERGGRKKKVKKEKK